MTSNQIRWQELLETRRANTAREAENSRHNLATEGETYRNNVVVSAETNRHNVATEGESARHNRASEANDAYRNVINQQHYERSDAETHRSNVTSEALKYDYNSGMLSHYENVDTLGKANLDYQQNVLDWKKYYDTISYNLDVTKQTDELKTSSVRRDLMTAQTSQAQTGAFANIANSVTNIFRASAGIVGGVLGG